MNTSVRNLQWNSRDCLNCSIFFSINGKKSLNLKFVINSGIYLNIFHQCPANFHDKIRIFFIWLLLVFYAGYALCNIVCVKKQLPDRLKSTQISEMFDIFACWCECCFTVPSTSCELLLFLMEGYSNLDNRESNKMDQCCHTVR